ncbi:MAG: anaerobic ribonucleoside-triphosphate reductase activating protein [Acholeplasmatales bacterium]|jgi:anaerobic ribonucleoside-triphosphate reductase activating protein|nr:anaerobic ribonucleoside-triphosphate reductase activating protein [Acholeplasmatales bacterium]
MPHKIRIANTISESIVDGPGLRYVIFTQGCLKHCLNCHNPLTWDLNGGKLVEVSSFYEDILQNPLLQGITLSGGEPFLQPEACLEIVKFAKENNLDTVVYSGYYLEELREMHNETIDKLLKEIDYLVDGPFENELRDLRLLFKGSRNQRFIDLKETLKSGKIITLYEQIEE